MTEKTIHVSQRLIDAMSELVRRLEAHFLFSKSEKIEKKLEEIKKEIAQIEKDNQEDIETLADRKKKAQKKKKDFKP